MSVKAILVVDDEIAIREIVSFCLQDLAGWQVLSASSAREGLKIAASESLDAIVLDLSMPGMDGFTFLQRLKANPLSRGTPVILLSARLSSLTPQDLAALPIAGAIEKPFLPTLLPRQIANFLTWDWE